MPNGRYTDSKKDSWSSETWNSNTIHKQRKCRNDQFKDLVMPLSQKMVKNAIKSFDGAAVAKAFTFQGTRQPRNTFTVCENDLAQSINRELNSDELSEKGAIKLINFLAMIKKPNGYVSWTRDPTKMAKRKGKKEPGQVDLGLRRDQIEDIIYNLHYKMEDIVYSKFMMTKGYWIKKMLSIDMHPMWMATFHYGELNGFMSMEWDPLIKVNIIHDNIYS